MLKTTYSNQTEVITNLIMANLKIQILMPEVNLHFN